MPKPCTEREFHLRSLLRNLLIVRDLCELVIDYAHEFQGLQWDPLNPDWMQCNQRALAWLMEGPLWVTDLSLVVADFLNLTNSDTHPAHSFAGQMCVMPCGRIASSSSHNVSVWNSETVQWWPWSSLQANVLAAFPDGRTIAIGYSDGYVFAADTESRSFPCVHFLDDPPIFMTVLSNNTLAVGTLHNSVFVFDVARGPCDWSHRQLMSQHLLTAMVKCGDGFATGDLSCKVRVWSAQGEILRTVVHGTAPTAMAAVNNGALAVGLRRAVVVYEKDRRTRLEGHGSTVMCVANLEEDRLASGDLQGFTRVWHVPSGVCLFELVAEAPVRGLAALPGGLLAARYCDGYVRTWDARGEIQRAFKAHDGSITHLFVLPTGAIITGGVDNQLRMWV